LVVSGLAIGIDGAAHEAAVREGAPTVAVIGGGHDLLSPRSHDRLARAIVDGGGAVVSEHPPGTQPSRGTFPRRNRVISGLADAVVVVEAGVRSGALLTAGWALEQGRECFLVPGALDAPQSAGCLAWLRDFAGLARIVAGIPQLLEDLGLSPSAAFKDVAPSPGRGSAGGRMTPFVERPEPPSLDAVALDLPVREAAILRSLGLGAASADEIAAVSGLAIGAVLAGLTNLKARGLVRDSYGTYELGDGLGARAGRFSGAGGQGPG
jgi:DNA processing protein